MTMTNEAKVTANADGSVSVAEVSEQGVLIRYRIKAPAAIDWLVESGIRDLDNLALSNTDGDLAALLALSHEFRELKDDVIATDRTERLVALWERFSDWRECQKIAEQEFTDNGKGGTE